MGVSVRSPVSLIGCFFGPQDPDLLAETLRDERVSTTFGVDVPMEMWVWSQESRYYGVGHLEELIMTRHGLTRLWLARKRATGGNSKDGHAVCNHAALANIEGIETALVKFEVRYWYDNY